MTPVGLESLGRAAKPSLKKSAVDCAQYFNSEPRSYMLYFISQSLVAKKKKQQQQQHNLRAEMMALFFLINL